MTFAIIWNFTKAVWKVFAVFFGGKRTDGEPAQYEKLAKTAAVVIAVLLILLIIAGVGLSVKSCYTNRETEQTANDVQTGKTATIETESNSQVTEKQQKEIDDEKDNLQKESVQTDADLRDVRRTDSAVRNDSFSAVKRKWCADHPGDSKCRPNR